jgi:hypothetical protein
MKMKKKELVTKKLSRHIMYFDKETDPDLINEIVHGTQLDFPDCEIIVKFNEENRIEELSNLSPSKNCSDYWLFAKRSKGTYPRSNMKSGKWLVFADIKEIDDIWAKIKTATENGLLGGSSKVSTAKPNPNAVNKNKKVVCVYTYDYTDKDDVMRIREEMRKIGILSKIPYKTDKATLKGEYQVKGNTSISTYYE